MLSVLSTMLMSLQSDRVRAASAALLGQRSLACYLSVSSALLDIYLPCGAAMPLIPHRTRSAEASHFLRTTVCFTATKSSKMYNMS